MDNSAPKGFIEVNEITDVISFLKSIDWSDTWFMFLIAFHIIITALSFLSRNMVNLQVVLFLGLLFMVYFSEFLNELGAKNWQRFSKQQYFDANGLFISVVFSSPILLNCIFLLARYLHQSFDLMAKVKAAQLKQQHRIRKQSEKSENSHEKAE